MQPVALKDGSTLQRFSVTLTSCKNALKEIGYQSRIENPDTMQKIVEKLPFGLRQKWREKADSITEGEKRVSIEDIADFVEAKARVANRPVFGSVTNMSRNFVKKDDAKGRNQNPRLKVSQGTNLAPQGNLPDDKAERVDGVENVVSVNPNLKCPLCEANHWLTHCHLFKGKSYEGRYKFVLQKGLCDNCLQSGYVARKSGPQIHRLLQLNSSANNPLDASSAGFDPVSMYF